MPGPLATMYAGINRQNDADYAANGGGIDRALFNSRLSRLSDLFYGGRLPDDDGGTIYLDQEQPRPIDPMELRFLPGREAPPTPAWRDSSMQAGPAPPVTGPLAAMYRGSR